MCNKVGKIVFHSEGFTMTGHPGIMGDDTGRLPLKGDLIPFSLNPETGEQLRNAGEIGLHVGCTKGGWIVRSRYQGDRHFCLLQCSKCDEASMKILSTIKTYGELRHEVESPLRQTSNPIAA